MEYPRVGLEIKSRGCDTFIAFVGIQVYMVKIYE
jgi:hypothetical protein